MTAAPLILGNTRQIQTLRSEIERLAAFDEPGNPRVPTVLLQGETGAGKGLVARVMHDSGPRAAGPFIDVNCAAIPETMLEAELFGFEAGAFTDARRAKPGLFESASGGTLFLDEIDSLSLPVQSKVLKSIEEKSVRRLGAVESRQVDVKLVTASQKDLPALVEQGLFRADLYHRLAVLVFHIPPLRERPEDALLLAGHFLSTYATAHGLADKHLSSSAKEWLLSYPWPGNVRELSHLMERVTLLGRGEEITAETLASLTTVPSAARASASAAPTAQPGEPASDEESSIRQALARTGGNVVRAAQLLGLGRNALRYRMRRLGIEREQAHVVEAPKPPSAPAPTAPSSRPASTPSWERKSVAVLAVAVTLPETADHEPWTEATRWERRIGETIQGFGGTFIERSPSRATAVFGVPRTLEQASLRAVRAALALQREVAQSTGARPEVRTSIHMGDVRVDTAAADPSAKVLPIGDVFSLPERLLGHAGAGEVLLSAAVSRRVERYCDLTPRNLQLGPEEKDRLDAHVVIGPGHKDVSGAAGESALTPFVGRNRELDLLMDAFERATEGHGQVVFVAGDAGIGKSRLLAEFRQRLDGRPHRWVEGRCASYGTETPFLPINDALRRYLGIGDDDTEASANEKIAQELEVLGTELAWTAPYVQQALSLQVGDASVRALDSASRRSELFRALSMLMLRAAEIEPQVIVVEDLHWIDPASEDYLVFISDMIPATRVLLVMSHRPGYQHPFGDRSFHTRITLPPLSGNDMAAVTGSILGAADVPETLRAMIATKAEGNPFFVEELTRSLIEEGALRRESGRVVLALDPADITVPDTIQDILLARIDRLAEESRRAIQIASVIGREFALRLLVKITEAGEQVRTQVEELRGLELIYEKSLHPELAYMFKHALTHDVAYESVFAERRMTLHRTIGLAIEELYADRLAEHYETLAYHFSRGEDWTKALLYHQRSAEKAAENYANRAVIDHCRRALRIVDRLGDVVPRETRRGLNEHLGRACFCLSEFTASAEAYEEAIAHSSDVKTRARHLGEAALSRFWAHDYQPATRHARTLVDLSGVEDVPCAKAQALTLGAVHCGVIEGNLEVFERDITKAAEICAEHPDEVVEAFIGQHAVFLAEWTGQYGKVAEIADRTVPLGKKHQLPQAVVFPTWFMGKARCCTGDYGGAISLLQEAYAFCDRIGDRAWRSRLLNTLGWCFAEIGHFEKAREHNERAAVVAREVGDPEILSNAAVNLAANHLALGRPDEALSYLEPIEAALTAGGDPWMRWRYSLHALDVRARYELKRGDPMKALKLIDEELAGARAHRAPKIEARAWILRASALLALEKDDEVEAGLREAATIAERIGYSRGSWQARFLLAESRRRNGDAEAAKAEQARAWDMVETCSRSLTDDDLRRQLLRSALSADVVGA